MILETGENCSLRELNGWLLLTRLWI